MAARSLDFLKPSQKLLVIDLLRQVGIDVSEWGRGRGGLTRAASNPKFCYNWSFEQAGEKIAVCLWHEGLQISSGKIFYEMAEKNSKSIRTEPGARSRNKRANDLDARLWIAYSQQVPLRVIVVDGDQRNPKVAKPKASKVAARLLDDLEWAVTEYDLATGKCVLTRGSKPVAVNINAADQEASFFEGGQRKKFILHRKREGALRRAKIAEALARDGTLRCEVSGCGFDFSERYGSIGNGYAQVHHLVPLSKAQPEGRKTSLKELAIVCANCHAMIHAGGKCRPIVGLIRATADI